MHFSEIENQQVVDEIEEYMDADPYLVDLLDQIRELQEELDKSRNEIANLKFELFGHGERFNDEA